MAIVDNRPMCMNCNNPQCGDVCDICGYDHGTKTNKHDVTINIEPAKNGWVFERITMQDNGIEITETFVYRTAEEMGNDLPYVLGEKERKGYGD